MMEVLVVHSSVEGLQRCWATDYHSVCEMVVAEEAAEEEKRGGNGINKPEG